MPTTTQTPIYVAKADLFKALAHPVRIRVLELLVDGDKQVSELLAELEIEASHLSQHLGVLRRKGVVSATRAGNAVQYTLATPVVAELLLAARTFLVQTLAPSRDLLDDLESEGAE
ncbi:helix-turn-helix transcriptional regulator [Occultella aeris]|uniref:Putative HTH-type transcriptional regulator/MT0088 n=1 Tax=Occultella aeris TaxID=2761496 RepID=A0A7M4DPS2_9MICO|nr:metalloregulator ArsR/SmtB family transcription factor [Occultella aeris]VZO39466.1 putative HTH-type transcriptional regulator/MT0088 [Occultella aeris]